MYIVFVGLTFHFYKPHLHQSPLFSVLGFHHNDTLIQHLIASYKEGVRFDLVLFLAISIRVKKNRLRGGKFFPYRWSQRGPFVNQDHF